MASKGPSRHFSWAELGNPPTRYRRGAKKLARRLEALRALNNDAPLRIISSYRSPEHNRRVGGATRSQHLYGRAADIPAGYATLSEAIRAGFTGIGTSGPWVTHVDVRPGPVVHWRY